MKKNIIRLNESQLKKIIAESVRHYLAENIFAEDGFCINISHLDLNDGHLGADMGYQFDDKEETARPSEDEILNDIERYLQSQNFVKDHEDYANENQVPIYSIESLPGHEDFADGRCYISNLDAQYKEKVGRATGAPVVVITNPFYATNYALREDNTRKKGR